MQSSKISGFFVSANNSYFKLDGAQQSIKLSINQLILYAKHFLCAPCILKFVSNRFLIEQIDWKVILFVLSTLRICIINQVCKYSYFKYYVFCLLSQVFCPQSYSIILFQVPLAIIYLLQFISDYPLTVTLGKGKK